MKVVIETPNGSPYVTIRRDDRLVYIQLHQYDHLGKPIEVTFDKRATPMIIDALQKIDSPISPPTIPS